MAKQAAPAAKRDPSSAMGLVHGGKDLPSVIVESYNLEIRDQNGFIGDRASRTAFRAKLDDWRERMRKGGTDPLGDTPSEDLSKKQLDALMKGDDVMAAALVHGAVEDYAQELSKVIQRFQRTNGWKNIERIAAGGGFKESHIGELAIARADVLLKAEGLDIDVQPIHHHPDEAGLIGAAHLLPAWMLAGHDGLLAIDIGGSNIRVGVVELNLKKHPDLSKSCVWKSDLWRHADDEPSRTATLKTMVDMLETLVAKADKAGMALAPIIGIGCPGLIESDGSIDRGGQNLPGGNWESSSFNLPQALKAAIPTINDHETFVIMHNDAVVQGLAEVPFMQDVDRWAIVTIGTGLGNASFSNRKT